MWLPENEGSNGSKGACEAGVSPVTLDANRPERNSGMSLVHALPLTT